MYRETLDPDSQGNGSGARTSAVAAETWGADWATGQLGSPHRALQSGPTFPSLSKFLFALLTLPQVDSQSTCNPPPTPPMNQHWLSSYLSPKVSNLACHYWASGMGYGGHTPSRMGDPLMFSHTP